MLFGTETAIVVKINYQS